jgi:hypothetical protein
MEYVTIIKRKNKILNEMQYVPSVKSTFRGKRLTLFFVLCVCTGTMFSQNITNTLGSNGSFIVKDGTTTFLTLDQASGHLTLNSIAVFQAGLRFLYEFGAGNVFLGRNSGNFNMTGYSNVGFGMTTLYSNTSGNANTAIGVNCLFSNTAGNDNTAVGLEALFYNTIGNNNTAVGYRSLKTNSTGQNNTAVGYNSLTSNTTGYQNTAVGYGSLNSNTTGIWNTAFGYGSLFSNIDGNYNTALGYLSLQNNTSGSNNTATGYWALEANTTGIENLADGNYSLFSNTTGNSNTASGSNSLYSNTTGYYNTALGQRAGYNITSGFNSMCLGYDAQPTIGYASNEITLGNTLITSLRCAVTGITSLSDARDKKNISNLSLGLDFIMKLKPRQFNWDKREWYENNKSDGSKMKEEPTAGFIAQELDSVQTTEKVEWLNLVLKNNPEKWEATPGNLFPIVVKAIQELKVEKDIEITQLKSENDQLKAQLEDVKEIKEQLSEIKTLKEELNEQIKLLKTNTEDADVKFSSLGK